jgi:COP9 signalosome complex subunit 7
MEAGNHSFRSLEPFLLMAKSAKGAGATKLIADATSAPGTYVFAELLEMPNIQQVGNRNSKYSINESYLLSVAGG